MSKYPNIKRIVKILKHKEENIPNEDGVGQGTHPNKNSSHVVLPSINKHGLRGFDSNIETNQGWSKRGIQHPKIDMR